MRVLTRPLPPPPPPTTTTTTAPPPSTSSAPPQPRSPQGIIVVGFIGNHHEHLSQLINRVLDSNAFGSGHLDSDFSSFTTQEVSDDVKDWFRHRKIRFYHEEEKGFLFLQFSLSRGLGFDESLEFGNLQGLLFMFSVCHIIIFIQEGSRFDTQVLKKFRILQAAKHSLAPFIKSQIAPPLTSRPTTLSLQPPISASSPKNLSTGRNSGTMNRNTSAISLMSGLGSYTSLFPGQCTPVALFLFLDDYADVTSSGSSVEEPSVPLKNPGAVVVLARPVTKSEGGLRKKLQSSLEAQTRFLIKKCRTLSGSEAGHAGSRPGGVSSSAPLFSLDASKAVVLLDRSSNRGGESLDFATGLVEDVLNGKATSDSLLLESHSQIANKEDILSVKEFIYRQSDILRGRGGLVANANGGSATGVGMVAVAAAAAAASAASGKTFTTPELPTLDTWLSSSQLILNGVLSAKPMPLDETEINKKKPRQRNNVQPQAEGNPLEVSVSWLDCGRGLNTKFSTLWCERSLPAAKEVYLKELPDCYPTSEHEAHLKRALRAFHSMVKGPTVQIYAKKLEDECTVIWRSGRQQCDAISLTGKPCMHQRHDFEADESVIGVRVPHSSGFVFLHACACGRSRKLRPDPYDFEAANTTFNCFPDCDNLLPSLLLPKASNVGPIQPSSWSLIRVGGARYYDPSKGLLQSGFSSTQKFLLKWKIFLEKQSNTNITPSSDVEESPKAEFSAVDGPAHLTPKEHLENIAPDDRKISFGKGLPNFTMRKPFSEVVAGSAASDSGFPPLQQRKQLSLASAKGTRSSAAPDRVERVSVTSDQQASQRPVNTLLQIGRNVVPVKINSGGKLKSNTSSKHVIVYVGFEHECSRGHRFLLTAEHLDDLGPTFSLLQESHAPIENPEHRPVDPQKFGKKGGQDKVHQYSNSRKSKELVTNSGLYQGEAWPRKEQNEETVGMTALNGSAKEDDGGSASSLLNRNLPIYMNCPQCRLLKNKKDLPNVKFASAISQLQRIFVVTPPFPVLLATCPVIQFEASCLPPVADREQKLQFTLGCQVILPPESFLTLRLPFVYGVQMEDTHLHPLNPFEQHPELTAWITKNTILQFISKGTNLHDGS